MSSTQPLTLTFFSAEVDYTLVKCSATGVVPTANADVGVSGGWIKDLRNDSSWHWAEPNNTGTTLPQVDTPPAPTADSVGVISVDNAYGPVLTATTPFAGSSYFRWFQSQVTQGFWVTAPAVPVVDPEQSVTAYAHYDSPAVVGTFLPGSFQVLYRSGTVYTQATTTENVNVATLPAAGWDASAVPGGQPLTVGDLELRISASSKVPWASTGPNPDALGPSQGSWSLGVATRVYDYSFPPQLQLSASPASVAVNQPVVFHGDRITVS